MEKKQIPFWEEEYRKDNISAFSQEPNKTLVELERLIPRESQILEVGCGEGQNVLYLAKRGYQNIDAFICRSTGSVSLKSYVNNTARKPTLL